MNPIERFFLNARNESALMRTDIKETKDSYVLKVDLPSIKKEDLSVNLEDGYLKVSAKYEDEIEQEGEYLYQERSFGEYSRSFYVGDDVTNKDIHAKLRDGVLTLVVDKVSPKEKAVSTIHID